MRVTKIATQGRPNSGQRVTLYTIAYKDDSNVDWIYYENQKVFQGNTDSDTVVSHVLQKPIVTKYVRFYPKTYSGWPSMRAELYGYDPTTVVWLMSWSTLVYSQSSGVRSSSPRQDVECKKVMEMMVAVSTPYDQLSRLNKPNITAHRVLTHVVEGFIIQESNFPFTADDDEEDYDPLHNANHDHNGDIDMELANEDALFAAHSPGSPLSNDESNDVFYDDSNYLPGHCEQCGSVTEVHHQRGPRRFCSTSCARRYSVSCSRKMMAYHARMKSPRSRQLTSTNNARPGIPDHRKSLHSSSKVRLIWMIHLNRPWSMHQCRLMNLTNENTITGKSMLKGLTGCEEYADAFVTEEIDGQALMLLKEEHMVVALKMKLGPALKVVAKVNAMKREAYKKLTN
ncbi:hypothetical protein QZH41_017034 [Actinostola sp. cb2023]|nr:hypothetical protein QZH41_017034 [Actinostola sp. cb2023]